MQKKDMLQALWLYWNNSRQKFGVCKKNGTTNSQWLIKTNKTMKYKLRAECVHDILKFLETAGKSMTHFKMDRDKDLPDAEFEFDIDLELSEVITILKTIPDSHVMYETVKPIGQYTGERNPNIE